MRRRCYCWWWWCGHDDDDDGDGDGDAAADDDGDDDDDNNDDDDDDDDDKKLLSVCVYVQQSILAALRWGDDKATKENQHTQQVKFYWYKSLSPTFINICVCLCVYI